MGRDIWHRIEAILDFFRQVARPPAKETLLSNADERRFVPGSATRVPAGRKKFWLCQNFVVPGFSLASALFFLRRDSPQGGLQGIHRKQTRCAKLPFALP